MAMWIQITWVCTKCGATVTQSVQVNPGYLSTEGGSRPEGWYDTDTCPACAPAQ